MTFIRSQRMAIPSRCSGSGSDQVPPPRSASGRGSHLYAYPSPPPEATCALPKGVYYLTLPYPGATHLGDPQKARLRG